MKGCSLVKLHINLHQGILEVEGDLDLVKQVYKDYQEMIVGGGLSSRPRVNLQSPEGHSGIENASDVDTEKSPSRKKKSKVRKKTSAMPTLDKNLDLSGVNGFPSLKEFMERFSDVSNIKKNVLFVKYLTDIGVSPIDTNKIFTCYSELGGQIPVSVDQSLRDTSRSRYGFINLSGDEGVSLSVRGVNLVRELESSQ